MCLIGRTGRLLSWINLGVLDFSSRQLHGMGCFENTFRADHLLKKSIYETEVLVTSWNFGITVPYKLEFGDYCSLLRAGFQWPVAAGSFYLLSPSFAYLFCCSQIVFYFFQATKAPWVVTSGEEKRQGGGAMTVPFTNSDGGGGVSLCSSFLSD